MTFDTLSAGMDEAVRRRQDDVIRRWGGKVPQTGIWDYSWGGGYLIPRVDFEGHAARIKFLHANAGRAYFGENSMPDALDGPKTYLIARLLEDVEADAEAILKEWFVRFAGPAAEAPLREIYRRCGDYWRCDEMKKSAMWPARNYIYNYPSPSQYFALTPRFTQGLAELARKVRACAVKEGESAAPKFCCGISSGLTASPRLWGSPTCRRLRASLNPQRTPRRCSAISRNGRKICLRHGGGCAGIFSRSRISGAEPSTAKAISKWCRCLPGSSPRHRVSSAIRRSRMNSSG
jgi:hypothetical protein